MYTNRFSFSPFFFFEEKMKIIKLKKEHNLLRTRCFVHDTEFKIRIPNFLENVEKGFFVFECLKDIK